MAIRFFIEGTSIKIINKRLIINLLERLLSLENRSLGEINFIICNDKYLYSINKKFLNHDTYTDIITFDYCHGKIVNAEIYVSAQRVSENAKIYKVKFSNELCRVFVHGILHLCGYNDKTKPQQRKMREKEDYYLSLLNKMRE